MNQNPISIESLAADERFQRFCLNPREEDRQHWENWRAQYPEHQEAFLKAQDLVRALALQPDEKETLGELARLQKQMKAPKKTPRKLNPRRLFLQIAAACLLLITAAGIWYNSQEEAINWMAHQTPFAKTQKLELPDGTSVTLNANSEVRYPEQLASNKQREVWLEGEAFFEVAHRSEQPFIVHTPQGDVRVLGTSFNVAQRKANFEVALIEGKVRLHLPNEAKVNLQPGEQANISNQTIDIIKIETAAIAAWRNNQMNFKNVSVARIIEQIEGDFGWQIEVKNEALLKRKINAQIPENNPQLLFEALTAIYDLKIREVEQGIYVIE
ncbi:MAG: FecR domain-containing protein [Bacteroidota bacterium]